MNHLIHGDCLEHMLNLVLKNTQVDMILTDPPYNMTQNSWDCEIDMSVLWKLWKSLLKPNGAVVMFGQDKFTARAMLANEKWHRYNLIWQKTVPTGFLNANRMPLRTHEDIMVFYNKLPTYNPQKTTGHPPVHSYTRRASNGNNWGEYKEHTGGGSTERFPTSILTFKTDKQKNYLHPTQKPVALCEWLIRTYTNENDTVLDCFMGSGTTGIACENLKRNFIGIELDDNYFEIARKRIEANELPTV